MRISTLFAFAAVCVGFALSRFIIIDSLMPHYALWCSVATVIYALWLGSRMRGVPIDEGTVEAFRSASRMILARREVRARVPRGAPRRESKAASDGMAKITAARSMATLVRHANLRDVINDICDCGDSVIETIRRMPEDTPAAVAFTENHLSRLTDALEKCCALSRAEGAAGVTGVLSRRDVESFGCFILAFRKQQEHILFEGKLVSQNQ